MAEIGLDAITIEYASIEDAKKMSGLRLVLGDYAVPGPWREACKGLFYVKNIPTPRLLRPVWMATTRPSASGPPSPARQSPSGMTSRRARSGLSSSPWPNALNPTPLSFRINIEDRMRMFGYCNEICGEQGYAWSKRLMMVHSMLTDPDVDEGTKAFWAGFGNKYGYSPAAAEAAPERMAAVVGALASQLERQQAQGSRFFIGNQLSALDIYWATFAALVQPLPEEHCPMATAFRAFYLCDDGAGRCRRAQAGPAGAP